MRGGSSLEWCSSFQPINRIISLVATSQTQAKVQQIRMSVENTYPREGWKVLIGHSEKFVSLRLQGMNKKQELARLL